MSLLFTRRQKGKKAGGKGEREGGVLAILYL
jgi:hypothetical protein